MQLDRSSPQPPNLTVTDPSSFGSAVTLLALLSFGSKIPSAL
jgi:hypothetical protein